MGELKERFAGIAEQREAIEGELASVESTEDQLARLVSMGDMFIDGVRNGFLDEVARDDSEERHALYERMGLRVELDEDGSPIISGPFGLFSYGKPFSGPHPRPCLAGEA
jgi:hypothetical protein